MKTTPFTTLLRTALFTAGMVACSASALAAWPASVIAKYEGDVQAKGMSISGKGEWTWHNKETAYNTTLKLKAFFSTLRSQRSQGMLRSASVMQPVSFVDEKRDADTTVFDYKKNQLTLNNKTQLPIKAGTLDRLNVLVKLGVDVQKNPQIGQTFHYTVAGKNKVQPWQFTIDSKHQLTLDINDKKQTVETYRVLKKEKDKQIVGFWYAPSIHVLPVRIELRKSNGDKGQFDLVSLKPIKN